MSPAKKKDSTKTAESNTSPKGSKKASPSTSKADTSAPKKSAKKPTPTKPDEMSGDVMEFITAIDEYKRIHQRPFPSWSEVLEILKELGYSRSA